MDVELHVQLAEEGADAERLDTLTRFMRQELLQMDVEDVSSPPGDQPPPDARAFDPTAVGELLVGIGASINSLLGVVSALRSWLARGGGTPRSVRMEIDGDILYLSAATEADQDRLVEMFISRHAQEEGKEWADSGKP